jgi:hypothetical protein
MASQKMCVRLSHGSTTTAGSHLSGAVGPAETKRLRFLNTQYSCSEKRAAQTGLGQMQAKRAGGGSRCLTARFLHGEILPRYVVLHALTPRQM